MILNKIFNSMMSKKLINCRSFSHETDIGFRRLILKKLACMFYDCEENFLVKLEHIVSNITYNKNIKILTFYTPFKDNI